MAGGARPDPFRTRKLSRRAPMVLRGQPVGEQGAADRWTALDPYAAGSGAGAPRGASPPRRPPSFLPISFSRGPSGALFPCRGGPRPRAAPPPAACSRAGRDHPYRQRGRTAPSPRRAPFPPGAVLAGEGRSPRREPGAAPPGPGPAAARRPGRPARSRERRPGARPVRWPSRPARAVSPASRAGLSAGPRPRRPDRAPGRVLRAR